MGLAIMSGPTFKERMILMTISPRCTVCQHPDIDQINQRLVAGGTARKLADEFGLNYGAIQNHRKKHLPKLLVKAQAVKDQNAADELLSQVRDIYERALNIMERADSDQKYQPAVSALKEARNSLELIGKLIGQLKTGTEVNITYNNEFIAVRGAIYDALLPYPEARQAVVHALNNELEEPEQEAIECEYSERN